MTVNCRHISANTFPWFCYVCGAAFISCFFPASCLFKRLPSLSSISLKIKKNYLLNSDGLSLQVARSSREEESEEDFKCVIRQKKEPFLVCVIFPGIIREFGAAPVTFFLLCKSPLHTRWCPLSSALRPVIKRSCTTLVSLLSNYNTGCLVDLLKGSKRRWCRFIVMSVLPLNVPMA